MNTKSFDVIIQEMQGNLYLPKVFLRPHLLGTQFIT